jgi:hypothetical protein
METARRCHGACSLFELLAGSCHGTAAWQSTQMWSYNGGAVHFSVTRGASTISHANDEWQLNRQGTRVHGCLSWQEGPRLGSGLAAGALFSTSLHHFARSRALSRMGKQQNGHRGHTNIAVRKQSTMHRLVHLFQPTGDDVTRRPTRAMSAHPQDSPSNTSNGRTPTSGPTGAINGLGTSKTSRQVPDKSCVLTHKSMRHIVQAS